MSRGKNKIDEEGVLRSFRADNHIDLTPVEGSFYIELMKTLNKKLQQKGDWIWMKDCLTNEILNASEIEKLATRYLSNILNEFDKFSVKYVN